METSVNYRAFISYSSKDREWADLIYKRLSHFRIPKKFREDSKWIRPICQDTKQFSGPILQEEIHDKLKRSDYLIVICSTNVCKSDYVNDEIQTFINLDKEKYIIPFIVNGEPYSKDENNECLPKPIRILKNTKSELYGINIKDMGEDAAITKVVSRMLNADFALLWNEYNRESKKRLWVIIGFLSFLLTIFSLGIYKIYEQNKTLEKKDWLLMENQAKATAEKAAQLVGDGDALLAQLLSLNILPTKLSDPDRPYVPEADYSLRLACENQSTILRGHRNDVWSACFSPDGSLLATVEGIYDNGEVRIWDVRQGCLKHVINVDKFVSSVSFSPDGNYLAFNRLNELVLWDLKQMKEDMTIKVPNLINSIAFNPIGNQIITTHHDGHDGYLMVWDLESGRDLTTIAGCYGWANFTSDGNIIAPDTDPIVKGASTPIGDFMPGPVVKIRNAHTGETIKQVKFNGSMRCLSGDGQYLISFDKCDAFIWDVQEEKLLFTLKGHNDWITSASFSFDGKYAITSSQDKTVKLWDAQTGTLVRDLLGHENTVKDAVFSPDGRLIASVSADCSVRIWDISPHCPSIVINNKDDWSCSYPIPIAFSGNQELIDTIPFLFRNLTYNPDGQFLASIIDDFESYNESVRIWDSSNGEINQIIPSNELEFGRVLNICFNPINQELAVLLNHEVNSSNNHEWVILFWDINQQHVVRKVPIGKNMSNISFSSDGKHYVTSSETTTVLWSAESYTPIDSSSIHGGEAVFSPNSKYLVTTSRLNYGGKSLHLWNKDSIHLKNKYDSISGYAFSQDDKYLALATSIKIVIWDIESNRELTSFFSLDKNQKMMFGPNGKYLYIYDEDGNISVRYTETGTLIYQMRETPRKDIQDIRYFKTDGSIDPYRRISGHIGTTSLAFRPDGRQIAYSDGTEIRLWRFPLLQELIDETRERFSDRQLTLEERSRYYLKETNR